jgi:preprotein translocase SecE subunit
MALAVKNAPEVSPGLLDRMAAVSLAGTVYVLGCLGIVFYLVPSLWWSFLDRNSFAAGAALGLVMIAAATGLAVFGVRLLGSNPPPGVRAGIFMGLVWFLVLLLLARWASMWVEYWTFTGLFGSNGPTVGPIVCGVVALALLVFGVRLFMKPGWERFLVRLEGQGWFSARAYKPLQGLRVRRGTVFGILVLVGAGIYTMLTHGTLTRGPKNWELIIPFTGRVTITNYGDARPFILDFVKEHKPDLMAAVEQGDPVVLDRYALQEINRNVDPGTHVKVFLPRDSNFQTNQIVSKEEFEAEVKKLTSDTPPLTPPETNPRFPPVPAGGETTFATLTLLPSLAITVPLLLLGVSLWLAWRIVNMPTFADFLIATEAELNKVSWTTQRRLVQDTIVVLVTTLLLTIFLFGTDQVWRVVLSSRIIGVLQIPDEKAGETENVEQRPW